MGYIEGINVVKQAKRRMGAPYRYGAERAKNDAPNNPIDCSELVQMAFAEAGLTIVDGAANQKGVCIPCSKTLAGKIPGALCFYRKNPLARISHVGISTGQENVIEANGTLGKVVTRKIESFKWTEFGLPKCLYG